MGLDVGLLLALIDSVALAAVFVSECLSGVDGLLARVSRVLWWTEELRNALVCVVRANLLRRGRAGGFRSWRMIATANRMASAIEA